MPNFNSYDYGPYSGGSKYNYIKKKLPPNERIGIPDKKNLYSKLSYVPNKFYCQFPLHSNKAITSFDNIKTEQSFNPNKATSKYYSTFQKSKDVQDTVINEFNKGKNKVETSNITYFVISGIILFILILVIATKI